VLFWPRDPGCGMGQIWIWDRSRSRINMSRSYFREVSYNFYSTSSSVQCFWSGFWMEKSRSGIQDPGRKNPDPGSTSRTRKTGTDILTLVHDNVVFCLLRS
jgi:hypothetical protein